MKKTLLLALSAVVLVSACKKDDDDPATPTNPGSSDLAAAKQNAVANYAAIVHANYSDALLGGQALKAAIDAFVAAPSANGFDLCKQAWLAARIPYGQTEVYRFYNGPIDDEDGPEGQMNAWPMDEVYVDYVVGDATAGIINHPETYPTIDQALIVSLNEAGGEANISTGYHAIEFLLWGQDLSAASAGERPYTDYLTTGGTAANQGRRGDYLKACAALLVEDLQSLVDAWAPGSGSNYRHGFEHGDVNTALTAMLQGMGFLSKGELAGERMEVAYNTQLQEDEHSCFSDNTHTDIHMNAKGVQNVYLGSYTRVDGSVVSGTSIKDLLTLVNSGLAQQTTDAIANATEQAMAIPAPFDQDILAGNPNREQIHTAILALKASGDRIAAAAAGLGLTIVVE